jgi:hypothetical protein
VALCRGGPDEVLRSEFRHDPIDVLGVTDNFLGYIATGPGENAFNSCRIANQHNGIARHRTLRAIVQLQHCGLGRKRRLELKSREVRFRRNAV